MHSTSPCHVCSSAAETATVSTATGDTAEAEIAKKESSQASQCESSEKLPLPSNDAVHEEEPQSETAGNGDASSATHEEFELIEGRDAASSDVDEPRAEQFSVASSAATLYELGPSEGQRRATSPTPRAATTSGVKTREDWGLPALRELLRFLTSIINPTERQNSDTMMACGLQLLAVALECAGSRLRTHKSVLRIVQHQGMRNLVRLLVRPATRLSQYSAVLRCCFLLVESLRNSLRWPLEYLLRKLLDIIAGGDAALTLATAGPAVSGPAPQNTNSKWSSEQRELALETFSALWRLPDFLTELFVNYDCSLHCCDLLENSVQLFARLAYPASATVTNLHLLSVDVLLSLVDVLEQSCCARALAAAASASSAASPVTS